MSPTAFKFELYGVTSDNALDAWSDLRGSVRFADMGRRLGIKQSTFVKWYRLAEAAGDRRAVGRDDEGSGVVRQGVIRLPGSGGGRPS